jgi:hypothetical protein
MHSVLTVLKLVRRTFGSLLTITLLLLAWCGSAAQCHLPRERDRGQSPRGHAGIPEGEPLLPESGLLTHTTYTSLYFGFSMDLPVPLEGHRLMLPIRLAGEHALLGIGFQDGKRYGTLVITAGGRREENNSNMTPEEEQQKLDDIARSKPGPGPMERLDYTPPPVKLKRVDKHAGDVHGSQFSAQIRDYMVRFTIQTNDKLFLEKARKDIEALRYFCSDAAGNFFTIEGKPFTPPGSYTVGPTIPTATVDDAIRARPAEHSIPTSGYFAAGQYRLPQLELAFTLPSGWTMTGAQPPLAEDTGDPAVSQRLEYLWQSCTRTLFRAAAAGGASTLEMRALDQSCMGLPAPASSSDSFGAESLGEYLQMLGRFGKIKSNHVVDSGGHTFAVYGGTVTNGPPGRELEHRSAQTILTTRYRKLILIWYWTAPTESDLRAIPDASLTLANSSPIAIGPSLAIRK